LPRGGTDPSRGLLTDEVGNAQFAAGITSQYGEFQNAEDLIRAQRTNVDPALNRASLSPIDVEATAEAKEDIEAATADLELAEGEKVVDVAVRGNALIAVIEDARGGLSKAVTGANDKYEPPVLSPAEAATAAQADYDRKLAAEAARLRQENELQIAEMRADLEAQQAEAIEKVKADLQSDLEDAQAEAAEESAPKAAPKAKAPAKSEK
jgi:hypothetical protein